MEEAFSPGSEQQEEKESNIPSNCETEDQPKRHEVGEVCYHNKAFVVGDDGGDEERSH